MSERGWQPIDMAPRDWTPVLFYFADGEMEVGWLWEGGDFATNNSARHQTHGRDEPPTHWMPLPEPPK